ncbi:MAG: sigma-70 family RNA polymerase sigma factor [Aerococcus urinaeequi]
MAVAERELNAGDFYNELLGPFEDVLANLGDRIKYLASRYAATLKLNGSADFDDLVQVGSMAVWKAYNNYTEKRSSTFETYCYYKINNSIRRFFEYKFRLIHIPVEALKKGYEIEITSYDNVLFDESDRDYANVILASEDDLTVPIVVDFLIGLQDRQRQAVMMRMEFFTMQEVGEVMGTSRQRIDQIISKARQEYLFYEVHGRHRKRGEKL